MKRLFVNRKEKTNPGDWWSTPKHYFDKYKNDDWVDILDLDIVSLKNYDQIIVGGGGLLYNNNFEKFIIQLEHPKITHKVFYLQPYNRLQKHSNNFLHYQ